MHVRTYSRILRLVSCGTLFFFCWVYLELFQIPAAIAAEGEQGAESKAQSANPSQSPLGKGGSRGVGQTTGERFEKALEAIRENVSRAGEKADKGEDNAKELETIKAKRAEIESADIEFKKEFSATEKKLKDAKLPKEILDRHYKFVKHYEDNLAELKANLTGIEQSAKGIAFNKAIQKTKAHLEKTKAPSRHQKLDPNNLPFRTVKGKERAPRLKKEEFEKDFGSQKSRGKSQVASSKGPGARGQEWVTADFSLRERANRKPILLAYNDIASDVPLQLPRPLGERTEVRGGFDPAPIAINDFAPNGACPACGELNTPNYQVAQATIIPPTADDLSETSDVQFTQDIQNLAAQLNHSPVKIYEWVRNNIEFVPTYGSIQGADMCLQSKQCNAIDTASLLIALLRSANLPARYVYGTIEVPIEKVMNWVGGFTSERAALNFMASGGIPVAAKISGGKIVAVRMEHAWVETYIPYGNYRGAIMDSSIKTWIPMDGSFKQYTYANGFDITATVPFDSNAYMSQVQSQNPVHYYQSKIQEYLDANMPETSIIDVKGYREISLETYHFLPSTLPYITVARLGEFAAAPAAMAAKITFTLSNPATGSDASYTASTHELAGKRLTISYIPATSADEALIASYGGFLFNVPAYMLNLKPVLRVEGVIKLTSEAINLGGDQSLTLRFSQPDGAINSANKNLIAGAYYAVGLDLQGVNENVLGKRNYQLTTNVLSQSAGTLGNDDLIGEHLFILATTYFLANDKVQKAGAKLFNTATARTISEGITSFTVSVTSVFGMPKSALPSGINMDVAMAGVIVSARDGNTSKELAYMDLHGLVGSYHEHDIFEKIDGFSSVSAVRALQVANANGIQIEHINSINIGQKLPTLQVSSAIKTDIQNAVNAGKEVTVSQSNITLNNWNGAGYVIKDPVTGAGAYMISGGLAGSNNTDQQDGMQCVQIYNEPYGWLKDNIDPQTRNTIATAAELNLGELIQVVAEDLTGMGYNEISQCVGLVRASYWAAGICLDMWSPWATDDEHHPEYAVGSCGQNNLVSKYHISGTNGVSYHYNLAFTLGINNSIRLTNDPLIGDIIFFSNTDRQNHPLSHEGIVISLSNETGMVRFIHAGKRVRESQINLNMPTINNKTEDKLNGNSWIADYCDPVPNENSCLAAALFVGYGTIRDRGANPPQ